MPYEYVREPLTAEDADRLTAVCETTTEQLIVWTLLDTGLRVGELCGLTSKDILWQQRQLRVKGKGGPPRQEGQGPGGADVPPGSGPAGAPCSGPRPYHFRPATQDFGEAEGRRPVVTSSLVPGRTHRGLGSGRWVRPWDASPGLRAPLYRIWK
jgi:hypothetical protein